MPVNNTASLRNAMRAALDEKGVSVAFGLDFGTYRSMIATYDRDSGSLAVPNYSDACLGGIPSLFWRTADGKPMPATAFRTTPTAFAPASKPICMKKRSFCTGTAIRRRRSLRASSSALWR